MHWFLYDKDLRHDRVRRPNDLLTLVRLGFLRTVFSKGWGQYDPLFLFQE